ncbi:MAG: transposase [Saprospiraceae bacterium]|nr:transposase [Saprospiraceae bacterium]
MMKTEYQRNLPHFHHIGASFFLTWRLNGSLPKSVLDKFKEQRDAALDALKVREIKPEERVLAELKITNHYHLQIDDYLDKIETGPHHLKNQDIANLVIKKMKQYDDDYYKLIAFSVMSNHVHALMDFSIQVDKLGDNLNEETYKQVSEVMRLIKGSTSFDANKILKTKGHFWQDEYFDRYIRNQNHFDTVVRYILNNPVKAKICIDPQDFPYNYYRYW